MTDQVNIRRKSYEIVLWKGEKRHRIVRRRPVKRERIASLIKAGFSPKEAAARAGACHGYGCQTRKRICKDWRIAA